MNFEVKSINGTSRGNINIAGKIFPCALGKTGTIAASLKREGDGKTPIGDWHIRKIYYRADKIEKPISPFETIEIKENFGWCDDKDDENYNKFILHPYKASAEKLWREDDLYDVCVVLGHNDSPIVKGMGSAIFLHIAKKDYSHTEGCVAINLENMLFLLKNSTKDSVIIISE